MSRPVIVSIPHRLGKDAAIARLKSGFRSVQANFGQVLTIEDEVWSGDRLRFRVRALGQVADGTIDVAEDHAQLEVMLPWLLAVFAEKITPVIRKQGMLLLEKK